MNPALTICPGCGLSAVDSGIDPPPRYAASAGCWDRYGVLLARSYGDQAYRTVHQLIVDAYAVQHPKAESPDQVRQVALCLMSLALFVEDGADVASGPQLHQAMAANLPDVHPLDPPAIDVAMTVDDVLLAGSAAEHERLVREWAGGMWRAWSAHHETIRGWNDQALGHRPE